jgi:hypothetical protein
MISKNYLATDGKLDCVQTLLCHRITYLFWHKKSNCNIVNPNSCHSLTRSVCKMWMY